MRRSSENFKQQRSQHYDEGRMLLSRHCNLQQGDYEAPRLCRHKTAQCCHTVAPPRILAFSYFRSSEEGRAQAAGWLRSEVDVENSDSN